MNKEIEIRILEIDVDNFIKKIESLGAVKQDEFLQKRYVYDFNPKQENKWIRLRTNGKKNTLTIKQVNNDLIDGTDELEIEVNDLNKTNLILNELGYKSRNYQENYRIIYLLNDVEISIDSWPFIPTYVELEGKSKKSVLDLLDLLKTDNSKVTSLDVESIYRKIYGIDVMSIKNLKFEEDKYKEE